jgi:hypothetical protein
MVFQQKKKKNILNFYQIFKTSISGEITSNLSFLKNLITFQDVEGSSFFDSTTS